MATRDGKKGDDYNPAMKPNLSMLLGGITPDHFLAEYWQKKPLLVRGALPGAERLIQRDALLALASDDSMESRFISQAGGWQLRYGPFPTRELKRATKPWTVLVQGVNLALPDADALMRGFDFIPYARLDDLMISYATDGGGVGPHFDSYDVFLIQGMGSRRWRIGKQKDKTLIEHLPVRILKNFKPSHDWILESGDMLYLPPEWAHDGTAIGECMTFSVGFRTFPAQELAEQFLMFLQDRIHLPGRYRDPGLKRQKHPAEIGSAMIDQVAGILSSIRWNRSTVCDFLGCTLTEPKPHVFFDPPVQPLSLTRFTTAAKCRGIRLDRRSLLLFSGKRFYLNGHAWHVPAIDIPLLRQLADKRILDSLTSLQAETFTLLHASYCDGFIDLLP
jgi:50S ribosomal protein L16 3-hydroxylase